MREKNGYFQLQLKNNGTYLILYDAEDGGQPIHYDELSNYLIEKKIYEFDKGALGRALSSLRGEGRKVEIKLSNAIIHPQDEAINVVMSEDKMYVKARFYPPTNDGKLLTKEDIITALALSGVKFGIEESNVNQFLSEHRYCTDYILAKALPPVQGHDAEITYHFNTDLTHKPKRNEDGSVDFHQLDMISHCKKGEVLATLKPAIEGRNGIDVKGIAIRPNKVKSKHFRHGNNISISEDGLEMYSEVNGHVTLTDGRVFVSDTYEIAADVDTSTGDIDYDGNVVVRGNVITGFSVRAKGDIEVYGVVEGAYIEAGGQIILRRGMQGMNRGVLKAAGNIVTKFIESAEVIADGHISTDSIMHSRVFAKGDIVVSGKRGLVAGGEIRSRTSITVKTAGSHMGTSTILEVGIDPSLMEEFREIEKEIGILHGERDKIAQSIALIRKKIQSGATVPHVQMDHLKQITQACITMDTQLQDKRKRYENLKEEIDYKTDGMIIVRDTVFPGTKIVISNIIYHVRDKVQYSKFIRDRADIKVIAI